MATLRPDPTFYPSAKQAAEAPPEELAYLAHAQSQRLPPRRDRRGRREAGLQVLRPPRRPARHAQRRRRAAPLRLERLQRQPLPLGTTPARRAALPRRARHQLVAHPHPRHQARSPPARADEGDRGRGRVAKKTGYASPHTVHCGPDGIYISALGAPGRRRPRRHLHARSRQLRAKGAWEKDRGPQRLAYDFAWHLGHDTMITSEWGTPNMVRTA